MSEPLSRRDYDNLKELITARFDTVDKHFDKLNGRVQKAHDDIGTLDRKVAVLEERSLTARDPAARWGALGSGVSALLSGLLAYFK